MKRFHLSVVQEASRTTVAVTEEHPAATANRGIFRSSPIFSLGAEDAAPLLAGKRYVSFFYSVDAFFALGRLREALQPDEFARLFLSHGLASILLFTDDEIGHRAIESCVGDQLLGRESWTIEDGVLVEVLNTLQNNSLAAGFAIPSGLDPADDAMFVEVSAALKAAQAHAQSYVPALVPLLNSVTLTTHTLLGLLQKLTSAASTPDVYVTLPESARQDIDRELEHLNTPLARLKRARAVRDEAVQISAILRNLNSQVFVGVPSILNSSYETGNYALLGFGGAFVGYLALYEFTRAAFANLRLDWVVATEFPRMHAPPLLWSPTDYTEWRDSLRDVKGVDCDIDPPEAEPARHLLYFSNRLGFRETKLSMSAAYLSLRLGYLPSWTLFTFTHEFMHAHTRGFFASLMPTSTPDFDAAYAAYSKRRDRPASTLNLRVFLQATMMDAAHQLRAVESGGTADNGGRTRYGIVEALPADEMRPLLRTYYHLINELATSVLDFNYFYDADPFLYVQSVWSSWLPLPIVFPRIFEYLLRTLCAVSSIRGGDQAEKFAWAYSEVHAGLKALKGRPWVDDHAIDVVIADLEALRSRLRLHFFCWCSFVDSVYYFLLSSQAHAELFADSTAAEQDDGSYAYDLDVGTFEARRINSPLAFLLDLKRRTLSNSDSLTTADAEAATLWMYSVLASALPFL